MTNRNYWRLQAETYTCPDCGAPPREDCRTRTGQKTVPHASRGRTADRCPSCGTKLLAEQEPGELCARCALVRSLETERATYYRRQNP